MLLFFRRASFEVLLFKETQSKQISTIFTKKTPFIFSSRETVAEA